MARQLAVCACAAALATCSAFVPLTTRTVGLPAGALVSRRPAAPCSYTARNGAAGLKALADGGIDLSVVHQVFAGLADAAATDVPAAAAEAAQDTGIFASLVMLTEQAITGLHGVLNGIGISNSYGISIIAFTLFIKAVTFPLTYQQLASTTKMQVLQPKVKDIQKRFASNPEAANKAIAELYKKEEVNPLSGCLPTLAQIPIFISLYRALLNLAKENLINEPFLWLPSLQGPTFQASPADSLNWLKVWENGTPMLGWHDTLCYLTIPVILVATQSLSQQLMQPPKKPGQENDTSQAILKYLPLLIGWFSLNVPAGLGVYWIVNNIISTASSVYIRNSLGGPALAGDAGTVTGPIIQDAEVRDIPQAISTQLEEAKGFGTSTNDSNSDVADGEIIAANDSVKPSKSKSAKKKKSKKSGR